MLFVPNQQELSTESSGEDGVWVTELPPAPASHPSLTKLKAADPEGHWVSTSWEVSPAGAGPVQDEMSTVHLHSGQQLPMGRKGYSSSEAVMVQALKKEMYHVRHIESLSEVDKKKRKGMRKGRETQHFDAMIL